MLEKNITEENIEIFVIKFYTKIMQDDEVGPFFINILGDDITNKKIMIIGHKDGHLLTKQGISMIKTWTKNSKNEYVYTDDRYINALYKENTFSPATKFNHHKIIFYHENEIFIWDSTYTLDKRLLRLAEKIGLK